MAHELDPDVASARAKEPPVLEQWYAQNDEFR